MPNETPKDTPPSPSAHEERHQSLKKQTDQQPEILDLQQDKKAAPKDTTRRALLGSLPKLALSLSLGAREQELNAFHNMLFFKRRTPGYTKWAWGYNADGQLGLGDTIRRSSPVQVGILSTWSQVVPPGQNDSMSFGLMNDGTLWGSGYNFGGYLGLGDRIDRISPVQVGSLSTWSQFSSGKDHALGLMANGTLWGWGTNHYGQLGLGDGITRRSSPVQVGSLSAWIQVSAGYYTSLARQSDGTLWAFGRNNYAKLGLGDLNHRSSPVQVGSLSTWRDVAVGRTTTMARQTDGTLWAWGQNFDGQLGIDNVIDQSSPVQVGTLSSWIQVSVGNFYAIARRTDGTLWAFGDNAYGQLGQGTKKDRSSPIQIGSLSTWRHVAAEGDHVHALQIDGTMWAWGENQDRQLGLGDNTKRSSPVQVGNLSTWFQVTHGIYHTIAFRE